MYDIRQSNGEEPDSQTTKASETLESKYLVLTYRAWTYVYVYTRTQTDLDKYMH